MEVALTALVLLVVGTLMQPLGSLVTSGDKRFDQGYLQEVQLPDRVLESVCASFGQVAAEETAAACGRFARGQSVTPQAHMPVVLEQTTTEIAKGFSDPLRPAVAEIRALEQRQRQGLADEGSNALREKIEGLRTKITPYLSRYGLEQDSRRGPLPLQCLISIMAPAWTQASDPSVRASLALWFAVHLDGRSQPVALDDPTYLALANAWRSRDAKGPCAGLGSAEEAASALAGIISTARRQAAEVPKAEAMRHLMGNAWWQWPLWVLSGLLLIKIYRRSVPEDCWQHSGLILFVWAGLGWVSRVWLPYGDNANLQWSHPQAGAPIDLPPWPLLAMAIGGLVLFVVGAILRIKHRKQEAALRRKRGGRDDSESRADHQECSSRFALAGLALFAGLGWLLLLDLSATGHLRNRFLGLYQQGYLWIALGLMVLATLWRQRIAYLLVRSFGLFGDVANYVAAGRVGKWLGPLGLVALVVLAFFVMRGHRQVTSEIGRLWLIFGVAWYFHVAGDLVLQMVGKGRLRSVIGFLFPLLVILAALILSMAVTDDMGPLLVSAYGGGLFLAAAVTYFLLRRGVSGLLAQGIGLIVLVLWFVGLTEALFVLGHYHATTASRLESVYLPLASANDQIGVITWFREATPLWGHGIGNTPWCGHAAADVCRGVPLQIQSDYTFTALWGLFGQPLASFFAVLSLYWLYHVIQRHGRVTSGIPSAIRHDRGYRVDTQAFLSWVCITWLILTVCQVAVTVAGNLRVLPLTGITYPFISFGATSLWLNVIFLGLAMSVDVQRKT